jgi:putative endonuclease
MTNDLLRRLVQHRESNAGFTAKYRIGRLVYFEIAGQVAVVIAREKQIKAFRRAKKIALITSMNPAWNDLSEEFK